MTTLHLLWGFFVANVLGYGGGPASIPLMENEIVNHYHWLNAAQFANALALGNALPGPLATKIATYVGFGTAGWLGALAALIGTAVPSALAMVWLMRLLNRHRKSRAVRGMTLLVQPVIAVLMIALTWEISGNSIHGAGIWQSLGIAAAAFLLLQKFKVHPVFVIVAAFAYGGLVIR